MSQSCKWLYIFLLFLSPHVHAQEGSEFLAVRGTIGERLVYQFAGTLEDIALQCEGGFGLMQFTDPILENDAIPHWTANEQGFTPAMPAAHDIVCMSIIENAEANEMALPDAQFRIKGIIDEQYEYDFQGNFVEIFDLAAAYIEENQIDSVLFLTVDTWDDRTITYETLLPWSSDSMPHIMRALSIFIEPDTHIKNFELY